MHNVADSLYECEWKKTKDYIFADRVMQTYKQSGGVSDFKGLYKALASVRSEYEFGKLSRK